MILTVCELFGGVGGFSVGLGRTGHYETLYINQYEPTTKRQHAFEVLEKQFGDGDIILSNEDINNIQPEDIPDCDVLVGGFCCQDYSVCNSGNKNVGIKGDKGSLWWQIYRLLDGKKNKPKYIIFENVDRLLISPANQRGRDFALMLSTLNNLGYACEWMVIDASQYGSVQRRKRTYIVCYHKDTPYYQHLLNHESGNDLEEVSMSGCFAEAFPLEINRTSVETFLLSSNSAFIDISFNKDNKKYNKPFGDYGVMINNNVMSAQIIPDYKGEPKTLKDILIPCEDVPEEYYINGEDLPKWEYQKGAKEIPRKSKSGFEYIFKEGAMKFPDDLNKPARTIITSCGSSSPSRFSIVVRRENNRLSRLTPIEFERLQEFPDNWTKLDGISDTKRAFFMGNALVTGIITKIGSRLYGIDEEYKKTN